jgi:endonuclease YncB( thermonuclease family)
MLNLPILIVATALAQQATYPVTVLAVHDGDTITARIGMPFGLSVEGPCRLVGFDAWEITRNRRTVGVITDDELAKGKLARDALALLLQSGAPYCTTDGKRDPYGRMLITLYVGPTRIDVAKYMKTNGHVR